MVGGTPGAGVSRFLREATASLPRLIVPLPPVPDGALRAFLEAALEGAGTATPLGGQEARARTGAPDWPELLAAATALAPPPAPDAGPPFTLILDDAHRIAAARRGAPALILRFMTELARRAIPFHLVLASTHRPGMSAFRPAGEGEERAPLEIALPPLTPREVGALLSRWSPLERLTAWALLGGNPRRLALLDPGRTLAAGIRALVLDPDGPLYGEVPQRLEADFQAPSRYAAVLRAAALGPPTWGGIAAAVPELEGSARLGPYLRGLEERGWLEARASLDAPPGSRSRRYEVSDPFVRFWFVHVLPRLPELARGRGAEAWEGGIRPELPAHLAAVLPRAARDWLARDAGLVLGSTAREVGGVWGPDGEVEVAGMLRNGSAVYGACRWGDPPLSLDDLLRLETALRRTRYGFTRETRHRILVGRGEGTPELRSRVARDPTLHLIGVRELVGEG